MNKLLYIIKWVMLFILIFINYWGLKNNFYMLGFNHVVYLILIVIFLVVSIKDLIKKDSINKNKVFNILSIVVFVIISFILLRAMYDQRFIFSDSKFISDLNKYGKELYGIKANYEDNMITEFFVAQNINYFIGMFILLFSYRFINKDKKQKKEVLI